MSGQGERIISIPKELPTPLHKYWGREIRNYKVLSADERRESPESRDLPEVIKFGLGLIKEYLDTPTIEDGFQTDEERAEWREKIEREDSPAFTVYENNKLRMNKISSALLGVENLLPHIDWTKEKGLGNLVEAHNSSLKDTVRIWKKMKPPETSVKLEFINETLVPFLLHVFDVTLATNFGKLSDKRADTSNGVM